MTVAELQKLLEHFPSDLDIIVCQYDESYMNIEHVAMKRDLVKHEHGYIDFATGPHSTAIVIS